MGDVNYLKRLIDSGGSVFRVDDLGKIWGIKDNNYLRVLISRMLKREDLVAISRGLYSYKNEWNLWELGNKYKRPSYISLESVLFKEGVIFQDYSRTVTCVSNNSLRKSIAGVDLVYSKIREEILTNPLGIVNEKGVVRATRERAIGDMIYLSPNFYFDNQDWWDKEMLLKIGRIYNNKRVEKELVKLCLT